jgi:hypothetical protein
MGAKKKAKKKAAAKKAKAPKKKAKRPAPFESDVFESRESFLAHVDQLIDGINTGMGSGSYWKEQAKLVIPLLRRLVD